MLWDHSSWGDSVTSLFESVDSGVSLLGLNLDSFVQLAASDLNSLLCLGFLIIQSKWFPNPSLYGHYFFPLEPIGNLWGDT